MMARVCLLLLPFDFLSCPFADLTPPVAALLNFVVLVAGAGRAIFGLRLGAGFFVAAALRDATVLFVPAFFTVFFAVFLAGCFFFELAIEARRWDLFPSLSGLSGRLLKGNSTVAQAVLDRFPRPL